MNIKILMTLILGIIIGISFTKLFTGNNKEENLTATVKVLKPSVLQKTTANVEFYFEQKIDSLNTNNKLLNKKLGGSRAALEMAKNKNIVLQTQLYDLIDNNNESADTSIENNKDDVFQDKIIQLINENNYKDSLYENIDSTVTAQVRNKDSTIVLMGDKYDSLKISFNESVLQQQLLHDQNKQFKKQFMRQKIKSKLLSVGLLILSGAAANYLIQH
ncbi:hypothetical protein [Ferruginibacter sp.]|uniref:hypothetical protein n=1 Tax=Ferruginibacter sp. TaxID=1940288 RepID=UPI0019C882F2|nr:hypothetical protein [Ferruginibacter sp.]MBC7627926.1 hypothetical protein [Ferruginibacter sp.]